MAMPFSGHDQRRQPHLQMFGRAGDDGFEVVAALGFAFGAAAGDRQQHLQIIVLLEQRAVQVQDLVARQQLASQTFDRGLDQRLDEREGALFGVGIAGAESHGDHCKWRAPAGRRHRAAARTGRPVRRRVLPLLAIGG